MAGDATRNQLGLEERYSKSSDSSSVGWSGDSRPTREPPRDADVFQANGSGNRRSPLEVNMN